MADLSTLPLVQPNNIRYLGSFRVPNLDGSGSGTTSSFGYGGYGLGLGPNNTLYFGGHDWHDKLAQITIPAIGGTAQVVVRQVTIPRLADVDPSESNGYTVGGSLVWNNRLLVSAVSYYDADGNARASHFIANTNLTGFSGPVRMGTPGWVGGYMGVVPPEWREALGGPCVTGVCGVSIISRSSYGPALSSFDPDQIGEGRPNQSTLLVGYPQSNPLVAWNVTSDLFNGSTVVAGVAIPTGTRSVLFFGRQGIGPWCYGESPSPCFDPTNTYKGNHAYPYRHQVWAYDANDLAAVRAGTKTSWSLRPYAYFYLPGIPGGDKSAGATSGCYDPATRRFYMTVPYGESPTVHVFEIDEFSTVPPPQPPTGTLSVVPSTINAGQTATATWTSQNATSATLNGGAVPVNGTMSAPLTQNTVVSLVLTGPGGSNTLVKTVTVLPLNQAPSVNVGQDKVIQATTLPVTVALAASAVDTDPLTVVWSVGQKPNGSLVSFANTGSVSTNVTLSHPGVYVLRLTASDGRLDGQDEVRIEIVGPPTGVVGSVVDVNVSSVSGDTYYIVRHVSGNPGSVAPGDAVQIS